MSRPLLASLSSALLLAAAPAAQQPSPPPVPAAPAPDASAADASAADGPAYPALVALVLAAPVVVDATIVAATRIKGAEAVGLAADAQRFYVEADAAALLKGPAGFAAHLGWLVDPPLDARGRAPRLRKARVLAFVRPVAGQAGQVQLVAPAAQLDWSPGLDARVRAIVREVVAPDAPPEITGVGNAFHVPGSLPGESETQIFLQTRDARPVSLSILRRPGEAPRWAVALSEIVDDAAAPPRRDTLLWYRLACGLPAQLPGASTAALAPADAAAAAADYRVVVDALGRCEGAAA